MSIQYIKAEFVKFDESGKAQNRVECMVSNAAELSQVENATDGSLAMDKSSGDFYCLDNGTWNLLEDNG